MSKSLTEAAKRVAKSVVSNDVMGAAPETPATMLSQLVGTSLPTGVTRPRPVTATRLFDTSAPPTDVDDSAADRTGPAGSAGSRGRGGGSGPGDQAWSMWALT